MTIDEFRASLSAADPQCLLGDTSTRAHRQRKARLITISRRGRVLHELDVVREYVAENRAGWILVAVVLIVDPERHASVDRHVSERDLVSVRWHRLQRNCTEVPPTRMRVRDADARHARLSGRWKIGTQRRGAAEDDADSGERRGWRCGRRAARTSGQEGCCHAYAGQDSHGVARSPRNATTKTGSHEGRTKKSLWSLLRVFVSFVAMTDCR
jgi:hypothetical protein